MFLWMRAVAVGTLRDPRLCYGTATRFKSQAVAYNVVVR